jgi:hypothetical protein
MQFAGYPVRHHQGGLDWSGPAVATDTTVSVVDIITATDVTLLFDAFGIESIGHPVAGTTAQYTKPL